MNTRLHTDTWMYRVVIVLGLIAIVSVAGILTFRVTYQPVSELLVAVSVISAGGLSRLLISPLNSGLLE
jgi:hypothetical protein